MGCRFAERCKYVMPECRVMSIPLREAGAGRTYRCILSEKDLRELYAKEAEKNG
jgi:peptide/nickel transport system ATP-binding protein